MPISKPASPESGQRASVAGFRAGAVAVVGRPNVGKSTLLNHLVGEKLSITSRKPQTTRHRVTGIRTTATAQLVFVDTPGLQSEHDSPMNRAMNRTVVDSLGDVDLVLFVVEALRFDKRDERVLERLPTHIPVMLVINKIDRIDDKGRLLPFIESTARRFSFASVIPVSAAKDQQLDSLLREVEARLPVGEPLFDADQLTDRDERFFASEFVREQVFRQLGEELPYATDVIIEKFEQDGALRRIHAAILVTRNAHKPIVVGEGGERIKAISSGARRSMERLFGGKVFLEVWVKVKKGWADDVRVLKELGY